MHEMPRAISRDELIGGRTDNFVPHPSAPQFRPSRRQCGRIEPRRTPPRLVLIKSDDPRVSIPSRRQRFCAAPIAPAPRSRRLRGGAGALGRENAVFEGFLLRFKWNSVARPTRLGP